MKQQLTWLDLYNYLHKEANDINTVGQFDWQDKVIVYDAKTGDEYFTDTLYLEENIKKPRLVFSINLDE